MACGTPVVASQQAVSALDVQSDKEVMVGSSAADYAMKLLELLESPELRASVGQAGRKFVERNHDWTVAAENLSGIYAEAIARRKALD
jgi:phosphatidylinositol alpha-1,6-mannosyltransferase